MFNAHAVKDCRIEINAIADMDRQRTDTFPLSHALPFHSQYGLLLPPSPWVKTPAGSERTGLREIRLSAFPDSEP